MVKINSIIKAIDYYVKCSEKVTLPKGVVKSFNQFHNETCGDNILERERLICCDEKGNIFKTVESEKNDDYKVRIPWGEICNFQDENGGDIYLTHNHPPYTTTRPYVEFLSNADIGLLFKVYKKDDGFIISKDGLSMFDDPNEWNYGIRGISAESPNGARITLIRGDDFNYENQDKVLELTREVTRYAYNQNEAYYDRDYEFRLSHDDDFMNTFPSYEDYEKYVANETIKDMGLFEKSDKMKEYQEKYRKLGMKLTIEFPNEYKVE